MARMLVDCTGTRHEVHESYNCNITKKVHQRTGEKLGYHLGCGRRQCYFFTSENPSSEAKNITGIKLQSGTEFPKYHRMGVGGHSR